MADLSTSFRTVVLTQDQGFELKVSVSRFFATDGDATGYPWKDLCGNARLMDMPPYYISDMPQALINMQLYAQKAKTTYISSL